MNEDLKKQIMIEINQGKVHLDKVLKLIEEKA